jgi:hypothetical protein
MTSSTNSQEVMTQSADRKIKEAREMLRRIWATNRKNESLIAMSTTFILYGIIERSWPTGIRKYTALGSYRGAGG